MVEGEDLMSIAAYKDNCRWAIAKSSYKCTNQNSNCSPINKGDLCVKHNSGGYGCKACALKYWADPADIEKQLVESSKSIGDNHNKDYPAGGIGAYWVITENESECRFTGHYSKCGKCIIPANTIALTVDGSCFYCELCCKTYTNETKIVPEGIKAQLEEALKAQKEVTENPEPQVVTIISFGYKHGEPELEGKDTIVDVRKSIRNPWQTKSLRKLSGLDAEVQEFIKRCPATNAVLASMSYYPFTGVNNIYIGCFGGRHRSVAIAKMAAEKFEAKGFIVNVIHRDLKLAAVEE